MLSKPDTSDENSPKVRKLTQSCVEHDCVASALQGSSISTMFQGQVSDVHCTRQELFSADKICT